MRVTIPIVEDRRVCRVVNVNDLLADCSGVIMPDRAGLLSRNATRRLVYSLAAWSRHQLIQLVLVTLGIWLAGSFALYLVERGGNPAYEHPADALWNVWLLLFSGPEDAPKSRLGRLLAMFLVLVGVAMVGFATAIVTSYMVESFLRRRLVSEFEMDEHIILCNWAPRGLEWIREVHSKIIQDQKRSVVIIHDNPEDIHLPDKQDEAAFNDVYIVKGDPSNDVILKRAKVSQAYSVVILADDREGKHADGKTILTCIAIRCSAAATGNRTSPSSAEVRRTSTT